MVGKANAPVSLSVRPASPTGGMPGPTAPAETLEVTDVCGSSSSASASSSERPRPGIVAGFQYRAPPGLSGAAVATPPNERLTAPVPDSTTPYCALADPAAVTTTRVARQRGAHFNPGRTSFMA